MELSWLTKIRIAVAFAIGVVLLGFLPWSRLTPDAGGVFAMLSGTIDIQDVLICGVISLGAGFLASAVCTPYGMRIGVLAAPAGMAVWSFRSADLSTIFQAGPAANDRLAVYSALKFEGFIWLAIAACGFIGAFAADRLLRRKSLDLHDKFEVGFKLPPFAAILTAVVATVVVGNFLLKFLAAGISYPDKTFGTVTGQPANLQIAFAVIIAFMACGFATKLFLGTNFVWPAIASAILTSYSIIIYAKKPVMEHLAASWPAVFFAKTVIAILPVQMVAFGCIGAVWGYWLAVSYRYWRKLES